MTFDLSTMYHVGLVVPDVGEAMEDLSRSLGLTWATVQERDITLRYRGELVTVPLQATYSHQGPIHIELIRVTPNSPWHAANHVHHFGFWTDDLHADVDHHLAGGLELEGTYDDPTGNPLDTMSDVEGKTQFAYRIALTLPGGRTASGCCNEGLEPVKPAHRRG